MSRGEDGNDDESSVASSAAGSAPVQGNVSFDPASIQNLSTAISSAIASALANALGAIPALTATMTKHSTAIDPYGTTSLNVAAKDGQYQWAVMVKMMDGWKLKSVSVQHADKIMDLLKDRETQFRLDLLTSVPTAGTGTAAPVLRSIGGEDFNAVDLKTHRRLLVDIHWLTLDHVKAFAGWYMGSETALDGVRKQRR